MNNRYPVENLEQKIGYEFKNKEYLMTALTHSSLMNERLLNVTDDYERQEFLGDAVLELVVSDRLFKDKPDMDEGQLTKLRSSLVCEPALAASAKELGLSDFILMGKGDDMQGSRYRDSVISDVFEALTGALYLDGGLEEAAKFIDRYVLEDYEHKVLFVDSKTNLQAYAQRRGMNLEYRIMGTSGPDHDRVYEMAALINGKEIARGKGHSKKNAEQHAAYAAYERLKEKD